METCSIQLHHPRTKYSNSYVLLDECNALTSVNTKSGRCTDGFVEAISVVAFVNATDPFSFPYRQNEPVKAVGSVCNHNQSHEKISYSNGGSACRGCRSLCPYQ